MTAPSRFLCVVYRLADKRIDLSLAVVVKFDDMIFFVFLAKVKIDNKSCLK